MELVESTAKHNGPMDDVSIQVDTKNFVSSKKKLSEASGYFNAMFNGEFMEKNQSVVKLEGVTVESWEQILHFVNHGILSIKLKADHTVKEMIQLLKAASMLQFITIKEQCIKILMDQLEYSNGLEILEVASQLDLKPLVQKSRAIVLWNFDLVFTTPSFASLNIDQIEWYLSDPALHSQNGELGVWESINHWINSSEESSMNRVEFLPRLIKCLHLNSLSLSDLRGILLYESIHTFSVVSQVISSIIKYKVNHSNEEAIEESLLFNLISCEPDIDHNLVKGFIKSWFETEIRKLPLVPSVVANVFSEDSERPKPCIVRYSEAERKLLATIHLTKMQGYIGYKVITNGCKIYLLGGVMMTRQSSYNHAIWEYDQIYSTWSFISNLSKPSRHMFACCIADDLYIMGGFGRHRVIQDTVEKLSLRERNWTACAPLPRAMYSRSCCVFKGYIYVIDSVVYQYNPVRNRWVTMDIPVPAGSGFGCAFSDDKYIYVTGTQSKYLHKFDPSIPNAKLEVVGEFTNFCTQACLIEEHVYSLSQDEFGEKLYCEKINIKTGECTVLWEGVSGNEISDLDPKHHHGCLPLLCY